jgi:hypothetical protein
MFCIFRVSALDGLAVREQLIFEAFCVRFDGKICRGSTMLGVDSPYHCSARKISPNKLSRSGAKTDKDEK